MTPSDTNPVETHWPTDTEAVQASTLSTEPDGLQDPQRRRFIQQALMGTAGLVTSALLPAWAMAAQAPTPASITHPQTAPALVVPPSAKETDLLSGYKPVVPIDFAPRLQTVAGLSAKQLDAHMGLYKGYVSRLNSIETDLAHLAATTDLSGANATYHPYRELQVERGFALNGVVWHELYFGNIGGSQAAPSKAFKQIIAQAFGSWEAMVLQLRATALSMRGWAVLAYCPRQHQMGVYGLDAHNINVPLMAQPLLVLDVYEHAYLIDFGTNRKGYLDAFMNTIDWSVVENRYRAITFP
jgi:superoxide dismutase, Fe-Mn family